MARAILLSLILAAVSSALLFGCGGDKGTSPSSKNYILFVNKFRYTFRGEEHYKVHVIIEACNQDFWLGKNETRPVECVPEDKSTTFIVKIETEKFEVRARAPQGTWSGKVSIGQTVTIKPGVIPPNIKVDVEG